MEPDKKSPIPTIHTYRSDVDDALKKKDTSFLEIAVKEQQKKERGDIQIEVKKNLYLLPLSLLLLVGTVIAVLIIYMVQRNIEQPITPPQRTSHIIATESEVFIPVEPTGNIALAIASSTATLTSGENTIARFTFIESTTTPAKIPLKFETLTQTFGSMPGFLARSLKPEYVIGLHLRPESVEPFMILKTTSSETAFPGMFAWEQTLKEDFKNFFGDLSQTLSISSKPFGDLIIQNKNVRIATTDRGVPVLLYSVTDGQTIVITTNEQTFAELVSRLTTSQFVQ
jgi:hypothetical protein